jgi:hypothetical protein
VEVSPKEASREDLFLHVFSVNKPVKAELLKMKNGAGVRLGPRKVVFSGKSGGFIEKNGKKTLFARKIVTNEFEK